MNYGIEKEDFELILNHIKANLGLTLKPQIFIFGSRSKAKHRKYSDIDLLLKAESYDLNALSNLDFEDLDTPYKVDFVLDVDLIEAYRDDVYSTMVEVVLAASED